MGYRHEHSPSVIATVFVTIMIGFLKFPDDKVKKNTSGIQTSHVWEITIDIVKITCNDIPE